MRFLTTAPDTYKRCDDTGFCRHGTAPGVLIGDLLREDGPEDPGHFGYLNPRYVAWLEGTTT